MSEKNSIAEDFDDAMENAIREYELKTELAQAEVAREKNAREAAEAQAARERSEREAEKTAREAAEARAKALEAQLAELLKKKDL